MRGLAAAAALAAAGAGAQPADTAWSLTAGVLHRRLVERDDAGATLVTESGPLLRLSLDRQWRLDAGGALRLGATAIGGTLDYRGQTQGGAPLSTDSAHREIALDAAWRPLAPARWGEGWLVLRAMQQRRHIASTSAANGLRETSTLLLPGVRWSGSLAAAGWRWSPSVELRAGVHHRVQVGFGGVYDDATLHGGARREIALGLDAATAGSPWSFGAQWTHKWQPASRTETLFLNGAPTGTVRQPRIRIDDLGLHARRAF